MKGDFSLYRFDATKHFNRVLKQQGRVDLDSDWNEQAAIGQHLLRTLIVDLLGPHAGPRGQAGFGVIDWDALTEEERKWLQDHGLAPALGDFLIGAGRYYVDGLLVESEAPVSYRNQPAWHPPLAEAGHKYLAYLDVWERHITYIEDDGIREVALNGPDTCTRVKTVWQVKLLDAAKPGGGAADEAIEAIKKKLAAARGALTREEKKENPDPRKIAELKRQIAQLERELEQLQAGGEAGDEPDPEVSCAGLLEPLRNVEFAPMRARLEPVEAEEDPCVLPPESRYRGLENHLYRIEIHRGSDNAEGNPATFKWSRENGSVVTRWLGSSQNEIEVASSRGLEPGQWVELTDDTADLRGEAGPLVKITQIDGNLLSVESAPAFSQSLVNPKLRRWDQKGHKELTLDDGAIRIQAGEAEQGWIEIEDGIEVQFGLGALRTGDYWLIPARVVTGDIIWPQKEGKAAALPPMGIQHHYAPLAMINATTSGSFVEILEDCLCRFEPLPCISGEE
jgi:hypothetical protein